MGRHRTNCSRDYFHYYKLENKNVCILCNNTLKGNHAANLERHLMRFHREEFENVQQNKKRKLNYDDQTSTPSTSGFANNSQLTTTTTTTEPCPQFLNVKLNKETITKACLELIAINGCPELLEYSGFKKLLNPIVEKIKNFSINAEELISKTATKIAFEFLSLFENKMMSLKIDIVTRMNKSIVSINAQLFIDGKLKVFALGMVEEQQKENEYNIKDMVDRILMHYFIEREQIYSIIIDNGTYIDTEIKIKNLEELNAENLYLNEIENNQISFEGLDFSFNNLVGIKCVTHALHLAIKDALEDVNFSVVINETRVLVGKLSDPSLIRIFNEASMKIPTLDYSKSWISTYNMLISLLNCKDLVEDLGKSNYQYNFKQWTELQLIADLLQPLAEVALKLQNQQLTLSDFFGIWTHCKLKVINLKHTFALILHESLTNRETAFLQCESLLSAVYLDPRYQVLLSESQKETAINHLTKLWDKLQQLHEKPHIKNEFISGDEYDSNNTNLHSEIKVKEEQISSDGDRDDDSFGAFIKMKYQEHISNNSKLASEVDIKFLLRQFNDVQLLDWKQNILVYWQSCKLSNPHLYKLAMVVFAVPATQLTLERSFSGLKFILQDRGSDLTKGHLEEILLIRNNFEMV